MPGRAHTYRASFFRLNLLIWAAFAATLAACWVIPYRLAFGAHGSWYTFGYIGDEYLYAQRIQPLVPGATPTNIFNGMGDRAVSSPFYLEDFIRSLVTFSGLNIVTFVWLWRILFPLVMAASLVALGSELISGAARPWRRTLCWALIAAIWPMSYCLYDLVTRFPPLQGFINRFPTNIEFPLSIGLACLYLRFLREANRVNGLCLAALSLLAVYLRPYLTLPWSITIVPGVLWLLFTRRTALKTCVLMAALLLIGVLPLFSASRINGHSPVFREFFTRYFELPFPYEIHPRLIFFLGCAAVFAAASWCASVRIKVLLWGASGAMLILPFVCALLPVASELIRYDRFGSFYLVVTLCALGLRMGDWRRTFRGTALRRFELRACAALILGAVCLTAALAAENALYDFQKYPAGPLPGITEDLDFIPAYRWIADNTEPDALFVVDDGFDWSLMAARPEDLPRIERMFTARDDLFQIVTRRRRCYAQRLNTCIISNADWQASIVLQRATFGYPWDMQNYFKVLRYIRPGYIFWRKTPALPVSDQRAPIPRGMGLELRKYSQVMHDDSVCEIWKIDYTALQAGGW